MCLIIIIIIIIVVVVVLGYHFYGRCLQLIQYTTKTNHVFMVHNVAVVLWLQCMVHFMHIPMSDVLYLYSSPPRIRAQCPIRLFSAVPSSPVFQVLWSGTF